MSEPSAPWQLSALALNMRFADGRCTPGRALDSILARLDHVNPILNAVIATDRDAAQAAARESDARWRTGRPLSPLDGVAFTVKDNIPVRGLPCRWGSRLYEHFVPDADELPVARLREAGMILIGKTNVPEFTLHGYTANPMLGITRNPWDTALTPGGSSGGAVAAVAAGIAPVALATDGGGSIRRPCGFTGLWGFKPGLGTVPRVHGLPTLLPGMEVIGPIARTAADVAAVLALIAAPDARDPDCDRQPDGVRPDPLATDFLTISAIGSLAGATPHTARTALTRDGCDAGTGAVRILYVRDQGGRWPVDPEALAASDAAADVLRRAGHAVETGPLPDIVSRFNDTAWPVISQAGLTAMLSERKIAPGTLSPAIAAMWQAGLGMRATALFDAQAIVREMKAALRPVFRRCDFILTPTSAAMPWPADASHPERIAGQDVGPRGHAVFTAFVNAAGLTAIAMPAVALPSASELPAGVQLIGPHASEARLCALAEEYERTGAMRHRWPALDEAKAPAAPAAACPRTDSGTCR